MASSGWIGVDLDATLAKYDGFKGPTVIGEPIPEMVERVKSWLNKGYEVRIMTARVWAPLLTDPSYGTKVWSDRQQEARHARRAIEDWTELHIGKRLEVTCMKDYSMWVLYDDRCRQVEPNTGRLIGDIGVKSQKAIYYYNRKESAEAFAAICNRIQFECLVGYHLQEGEAAILKKIIDQATEVIPGA